MTGAVSRGLRHRRLRRRRAARRRRRSSSSTSSTGSSRRTRRTSSSPTRWPGSAQAKKDGKIAILIGIEGGHAIEDSLGALSAFYRLGVRYMTLTHTNTNDWADSSGTFFGLRLRPEEVRRARRADRLRARGRARDEPARHAGGRLARLATRRWPTCSRSRRRRSSRRTPPAARSPSIPRNLTDDQIQAIAAKGGVVMVNVSSLFLDQKSVDDYVAAEDGARAEDRRGRASEFKDDPKKRDAEIAELMETIHYPDADWTRGRGPHRAGHEDRRARRPSASAPTSTGSTDPPAGLEDVSKLPKLTEELLRRGHSEEEVRGVLGENFLASGTGSRPPGRPCRRGPSRCRSRSRTARR